MRKAFRLVLATCAIAVVTAGAASAAGGGAQKFDLLGPNGNAYCDGSGVLSGAPGGFGFAVINAPTDTATVQATVSAKGLTPNTTYQVLLVQSGDFNSCFTPATTLTTNGQGKGNAVASAPSNGSAAFVAVCGGASCGDADVYVTNTYNH